MAEKEETTEERRQKASRSARIGCLYVPLAILLLFAAVVSCNMALPCSNYIVIIKNQTDQPISNAVLKGYDLTLWEGALRPGEERILTFQPSGYYAFSLSAMAGGRPLKAVAAEYAVYADEQVVFTFEKDGLTSQSHSLDLTWSRRMREKSSLKIFFCPT